MDFSEVGWTALLPLHAVHLRLSTVASFLQCMKDTDDPRKCKALKDDYLECLHHRKEVCAV